MNITKLCIVLIVLVASIGIIGVNSSDNTVYGAETWITPTNVSVSMTDLYATIHVHIKNNKNHVQYFKISQTYTANLNSPINWRVIDTNPNALNMIDSVSSTGDLGWKINPGETKEVTFTLLAVGNSSSSPLNFVILNQGSAENTYWPLIPDPGLYSSWFQPNEIEMLNPSLDLKYWKGTFSFLLVNNDDSRSVSGIIRAPIVPTDSKLISSSPKVTFSDKDLVLNGRIAAWDVTMDPGSSRGFTYAYTWPSSSSSSSSSDPFKSSVFTTNAASTTSPVSTKDTGVPYAPFIIGGILAAGGLAYARLRR